ncbi:MAG: tyrosine-type recombinase/integrase [Bacteroidetes bacterium]|nr:tyrosine-type recombinase/integrase [Bacteroidota bacterium]
MTGFLNYLQHEKRYSKRTVVSYHSDLKQFFNFLRESYGEVNIADITTRQVRGWIVYMMQSRKLTTSSVRRKISSLNTYFNYQMKRQGLKSNPAKDITPLKLPRRIPQYLTDSAMEQMTDQLEMDDQSMDGLRSYLIIEMLYSTGMRRQELIDLSWSDLDESRKSLNILGKGNKERHVPISAGLIAKLNGYRQMVGKELGYVPDNILVTDKGKKLYPKYVYNSVRKNLTLYSSLKKRSPHILRHTFATHLLNNGADLNDIKELLGHSSLASTQVYTHNSIEELKSIYKQAHPKS